MEAASNKQEIGALYGFRAIMVLLVANFHIWQQSWLSQELSLFGVRLSFDYITRASYVFVDGLILLSGFLLFLPHARQMAQGGSVPGVKRFYLNRLIRIVPSYLLAVLTAFFLFALPQGAYSSEAAMGLDLASHLTFSFTFFRDPYLFTPLNGVLWTVCIEMQFYLIFPLLAKAARKRPALTLSLMAALGWLYRLWVYRQPEDTSLLINQLPAFMDVYALGMLGAMAFVWLEGQFKKLSLKSRALVRCAAVGLQILSVAVVLLLLQAQSVAGLAGFEPLRRSQLALRLPLTLALTGCILSAAFLPKPLEWLLSNRLMRFLAAVSFNFYIWHQFLAVQFARYWFPDTLHTDPGLQWAFTLLCYASALLAAMAATYGVEQPVARLCRRRLEERQRQG